MPKYMKEGWPTRYERSADVTETVSTILSEVEREGLTAIRRRSERLDCWNPDSFVVPAQTIEKRPPRSTTPWPSSWSSHEHRWRVSPERNVRR